MEVKKTLRIKENLKRSPSFILYNVEETKVIKSIYGDQFK